ncbi:MAG TPA: hypothetical protein VJG66_04665 [Patescibacteria group bacterium]|nr:hypothetical protein [Patescibacteria group bacterium]
MATTAGPQNAETSKDQQPILAPSTVPEPTLIPQPIVTLPQENTLITALKTEISTPGTILRNWVNDFGGSARLMDCSSQENRAPLSVNTYPGLTGLVHTEKNTGINVRINTPDGYKVGGLVEGGRYSWLAELDVFKNGELRTIAISPMPVTNQSTTAAYLRRVQNETLFAERRRIGSDNFSNHNSMIVNGAPKRCKSVFST